MPQYTEKFTENGVTYERLDEKTFFGEYHENFTIGNFGEPDHRIEVSEQFNQEENYTTFGVYYPVN